MFINNFYLTNLKIYRIIRLSIRLKNNKKKAYAMTNTFFLTGLFSLLLFSNNLVFSAAEDFYEMFRDGYHDSDRLMDNHIDLLSALDSNSSEEVSDYLEGKVIDRHLLSICLAGFSHNFLGDEGVEIVDALVSAGADVNLVEIDKDLTALMNTEDPDVIRALLQYGAPIDQVNSKGSPALVCIIKYFEQDESALPLVEILLEQGADRTIEDYQGKKALNYAVEKGFDQIVSLLEN